MAKKLPAKKNTTPNTPPPDPSKGKKKGTKKIKFTLTAQGEAELMDDPEDSTGPVG
jgi:hypothetical protein